MPAGLRFAPMLCLALLAPGVARAYPDLPELVQDEASIPCVPHCTLCHRDDNGGAETVDRPFGKSFFAAGGAGDYKAALQGLEAERTDSDEDGAVDVDELAAGTDPNTAYDGRLCGPTVGCAASGGGAPSAGQLSLLVLSLVAFARRRHPKKQ